MVKMNWALIAVEGSGALAVLPPSGVAGTADTAFCHRFGLREPGERWIASMRG
jgi:hypothetical protein